VAVPVGSVAPGRRSGDRRAGNDACHFPGKRRLQQNEIKNDIRACDTDVESKRIVPLFN